VNPSPQLALSATRRRYALVLGILTALFGLRVVGQPLTALVDVTFLPPFERWYSGVIPYPLLLPLQIALLALMIVIVRDTALGSGSFATLTRRTGRILRYSSYLYALVMVARYTVTMTLHSELRWFTGTTPIWFHFVLASFLFTLGHYHATRAAAER
jgi:hypothetical protein